MKDEFAKDFGPMMPKMPSEQLKTLHFNRTSYWCCILECRFCDQTIRYEFDFDKPTELVNFKTGEPYYEYEKVHIIWNTHTNGQVLANGELQDRENTPEGTKCECFCHATRRKNMIANDPSVAKVLSDKEAQKLV